MDVHTLISLFSQDVGTAVDLGEAGTAALAFETGPTVNLEHDPVTDSLQCYVVLGQAPADPQRRDALFRQLLVANVFGRDTDGATLGLDDITNELILSRRLELSRADAGWLRATVESLVAVAQDWRQRLDDPAADGAAARSSARQRPAAGGDSLPGLGLRV